MLPKGNIQQNSYFAYRALCAVIHVVWIAAFLSCQTCGKAIPWIILSLVEFTIVLYHTPFCAPILLWARISYISGCCNKGYLRCRSPPSDFDVAYQPKNRNWRNYP